MVEAWVTSNEPLGLRNTHLSTLRLETLAGLFANDLSESYVSVFSAVDFIDSSTIPEPPARAETIEGAPLIDAQREYLTELHDIYIPTLKSKIDTLLLELDGTEDAQSIQLREELTILRAKLDAIQSETRLTLSAFDQPSPDRPTLIDKTQEYYERLASVIDETRDNLKVPEYAATHTEPTLGLQTLRPGTSLDEKFPELESGDRSKAENFPGARFLQELLSRLRS